MMTKAKVIITGLQLTWKGWLLIRAKRAAKRANALVTRREIEVAQHNSRLEAKAAKAENVNN